MKRLAGSMLIMAGLLAASAVRAATDGGGVWVGRDGATTHVAGADLLFLNDEGDWFDVAALRDGESRTFGEGDKQLRASREGDMVTLRRGAAAGEGHVEIVCVVGQDTCKIMALAGSDRVALMIEKRHECVDGEPACDDVVVSVGEGLGASAGAHVVIERTVDCDGDECEESVVQIHGGEGAAGLTRVIVNRDGGEGKQVFVHAAGSGDAVQLDGDGVDLGCPKGDARLRVEPDEAQQTFLCPRHALPMEPLGRVKVRRIQRVPNGKN